MTFYTILNGFHDYKRLGGRNGLFKKAGFEKGLFWLIWPNLDILSFANPNCFRYASRIVAQEIKP